MAKKNKITYERVDGKYGNYKGILVKFNPSFESGSDFEIEFIPLEDAINLGKIFVTEIDSVSTIDLYRWAVRERSLADGIGSWERGYIPPIKYHVKFWRKSEVGLEPRQVISRVKRVFESIAGEFGELTSFVYNHFLWSGQLGSLPFANEDFNIGELRKIIEKLPYPGFTGDGEKIKRSFVEHLFNTHKTEYMRVNICWFLQAMSLITKIGIYTGEDLLISPSDEPDNKNRSR